MFLNLNTSSTITWRNPRFHLPNRQFYEEIPHCPTRKRGKRADFAQKIVSLL